MDKKKMTKQQKGIILISMVVLFFAIGKHFFMPIHLPNLFFLLELFSFLALLTLIVYVDKNIKNKDLIILEQKQLLSKQSQLIENLETEVAAFKGVDWKDKKISHAFEDVDKVFAELPHLEDKKVFSEKFLSMIAQNCEVVIGLFFTYNEQSGSFCVEGNYGLEKDEPIEPFLLGEGLLGQALKNNEVTILDELPEEYFNSYSGLGEAKPKFLYILPIADKKINFGVVELASFKPIQIKEHWPRIKEKILTLAATK